MIATRLTKKYRRAYEEVKKVMSLRLKAARRLTREQAHARGRREDVRTPAKPA